MTTWAKRRTAHGETCSAAINDLGERTSKLHSHPHEQISYIVSGSTDFVVGDKVFTVSPGDLIVIPANVPHGGGSHTCRMVDFFAPKREEFPESTDYEEL
jgi:quercetin dioxygenase-like cupin family protein